MSGLHDAAGLEWERQEDASDDGAWSSTTIVGPDGVAGRQWSPSVSGSLEAKAAETTPVKPRREMRGWTQESPWDGDESGWSSSQGWSWSWTAWEGDPWASYLDSHRPDWRRQSGNARGYANWSTTSESGDSESPPGTEVPFPRLLARRENKSDPPSMNRAQYNHAWEEQGGRRRLHDPPRVHNGSMSGGAHGLRPELPPLRHDSPQGLGTAMSVANGLRPELHPLRDDSPPGLGPEPAVADGLRPELHPLRHDSQHDRGIGQLQSGGRELESSKSVRRGGEGGPGNGGQGYLRLHSSFPPEFRARPGESWKDYWRAVEFWLASEGINLPPEVRSSRLMQQLKERAAKIVNHLSVADVACEDGVAIIRKEMEKSPIIKLLEHKEVDRKRQKFMRLSRYAGESLESFINRASIYRHENDQCQNYKVGSKFYLGHLLDAAKLTKKDEALVKTAAGGLHEEGRVVSALLELSEQLEGQPGWPIGKGEPDLPDEDEFLVQKNKWKLHRDRGGADERSGGDRGRHRHKNGRFSSDRFKGKFKKRFKQVFHAILEDNSDESSSDSGDPSEGEEPARDDEDKDGSGSSTEPSEGMEQQAPAEIFAQEHRAKKRVNELKQMRQYFQKGTNGDRTKAWVKEQQRTEPCFLCQKLGHWSQECPLRKRGGQKPSSSHQVHVTSGPYKSDPGQWELLQSIAEYMDEGLREGESDVHACLVTVASESAMAEHEVFWSMRELQSSLILDLGCMKSVAGTRWVNQHIRHLKALGRWMKATKESESFRFGDGHELKSCFSFTFEATVLGVQVILRLSVVPGDCPPLLSKPACSQLSFVIDTENNTVSSKKLGVVKYGLAETYGGHYAVPIAEFHESMKVACDPPVPGHLEAIPVYVSEPVLSPPEAQESVMPSSGLRSWTRHDRGVSNTVGPGKVGPQWSAVVRRVVYNTLTGERMLDELVDSQTIIRKPWPQKLDTTTIFLYRISGSSSGFVGESNHIFHSLSIRILLLLMASERTERPPSSKAERPTHHKLNTESEPEEDGEHGSETPSGWEGVRPLEETSQPRRRHLTMRHAKLARRAVVRSKSGERARSKSAEQRKTRVNKDEKLKEAAPSSATPGSRSSKGTAPPTPVEPKVTKALLEARAKELEDRLWRHMDPTSIHTPGSKATKQYWVTRVEELEKEWRLCQMTPFEMELDKQSLDGEEDSEEADKEPFDVEGLKESDEKTARKSPAKRSSTPVPPRPSSAPSTTTRTRGSGPPRVKALTDHAAPFPSLSNKFSDDVVINLALSLQGQLFAFKWKMFTWMLRVRRAVRLECGPKTRWRRNPRWLMLLFGRQVAAMWGHLGSARQLCNDPRQAHLMQGALSVSDAPPEGSRRS